MPGHSDRSTWGEIENVQPIQVGQVLKIETLDGIRITAEIESIELSKQ